MRLLKHASGEMGMGEGTELQGISFSHGGSSSVICWLLPLRPIDVPPEKPWQKIHKSSQDPTPKRWLIRTTAQ